MRRLVALGLAAVAGLAVGGFAVRGGAAEQTRAPVVLELFTSQACSSCPPADALLAELADRPDLLALDLHVDYWDGPGWRDPYSSAAFTRRQNVYAATLGQDAVYTPELVVAGTSGVVGSDRRAVAAAIDAAESAGGPGVRLTLGRAGEGLVVMAGADPRADAGAAATLWLVGYDGLHRTAVRGGENGGRVLVERNVVRSFRAVGRWSGAAARLMVPVPAGERSAVLLQADDGRMLGAALLAP